MKELTIEEKAARYDEAIDIARKINSGEGVAAPSGWTTCEVIFPELKESEDEKIRKTLIDYFNTCAGDYYGELKRSSILSWLEKQGEHANFRNKIQVGDKVTRNEDGVLVNLSQLKRIAKKDEKQGEQKKSYDTCDSSMIDNKKSPYGEKRDFGYFSKPANKVEPKFKVGDWVVQENNGVYKVIKVRESWYEVANNKDCSIGFISFNKECICHRWTIQDAKNGDVLVCPKYAGDIIPNIFIFKNIERKDNDVFCHCSFLEKFRTEGYVANADPINTDFYPATKEQRDQLEKAMTDAGYTFDFEKKELKKA